MISFNISYGQLLSVQRCIIMGLHHFLIEWVNKDKYIITGIKGSIELYGLRRKKTCLLGLLQSEIQTLNFWKLILNK